MGDGDGDGYEDGDDRPPHPDDSPPEPLPQARWESDLGPCHWHDRQPAQAKCAGCDRLACGDCLVEARAPGHGPGEEVTVGVCPTCAPLFGVESSIPFEQPERSFFGGFFTTFGWALGKPNQLWRSFPHGNVGRASLFAIVAFLPVALFSSCCLGGLFLVIQSESPSGTLDPATSLALVISLAITWGVALLYPALLAVLSLPVQLCTRTAGSPTPWAATYRMLCYLTPVRVVAIPASLPVTVVASIIPLGGVVGYFLPEVWHGIVLFHGVRRVHGISGGWALFACVLPSIALCAIASTPAVIALVMMY